MKFIVLGSGGVGGYFGARLYRAGEQVRFIARGAHLEAMKSRGLRVVSRGESFLVPPSAAAGSLTEVEPADVILFCVKSYDTEATAKLLAPVLHAGSVVISLQNGVDNEEKIKRNIPTGRVFGGVAYIYASITRPGEVMESGSPRKIQFAPLPGGSEEDRAHARVIRDACVKAGIDAEVPEDIAVALWKKFIFITGAAGITALTGLTLGEVLEVAPTRRLMIDAMHETEAVARARKIPLEPGFLTAMVESLSKFDPGTRSSLYHDLAHEKPMELEALAGAVVRYGEAAGVPTPIQRTIYASLLPYHLRHTQRMPL
jgi:2-dehydropantoate 2-reductase